MQPILSRFFIPMIHLPPAHLADTQAKLGLLYNGLAGADTSKACHTFTCTQKPCVGASFDVPEDATAEDLEDAYIAKRDQFVIQVNADLLKSCQWIENVMDSPQGSAIWREIRTVPGAVEWVKTMDLAILRATR